MSNDGIFNFTKNATTAQSAPVPTPVVQEDMAFGVSSSDSESEGKTAKIESCFVTRGIEVFNPSEDEVGDYTGYLIPSISTEPWPGIYSGKETYGAISENNPNAKQKVGELIRYIGVQVHPFIIEGVREQHICHNQLSKSKLPSKSGLSSKDFNGTCAACNKMAEIQARFRQECPSIPKEKVFAEWKKRNSTSRVINQAVDMVSKNRVLTYFYVESFTPLTARGTLDMQATQKIGKLYVLDMPLGGGAAPCFTSILTQEKEKNLNAWAPSKTTDGKDGATLTLGVRKANYEGSEFVDYWSKLELTRRTENIAPLYSKLLNPKKDESGKWTYDGLPELVKNFIMIPYSMMATMVTQTLAPRQTAEEREAQRIQLAQAIGDGEEAYVPQLADNTDSDEPLF